MSEIPHIDDSSQELYLKRGQLGVDTKKSGSLARSFQHLKGRLCGKSYDSAQIAAAVFDSTEKERADDILLLSHHLSHLTKRDAATVGLLVEAVSAPDSPDAIKALLTIKKALSFLSHIQKKLPKDSHLAQTIGDIQERVSVYSTWDRLGLEMSALETDYDSCTFLIKQRLIYTIVGFSNTSSIGWTCDQLQFDKMGKLTMRVEGTHVPVEEIKKRFSYNRNRQELVENKTQKGWTYTIPSGLVPRSSYDTQEIIPVTRLTKKEHTKLLTHAKTMESSSFASEPSSANCIFQICTNPRQFKHIPFAPPLDGIHAFTETHVGFRIIDQNGNVYSSGFTWAEEEDTYCDGLQNALATISGMPGILDYEEFRPYEDRLVTSIPMTQETCDQMLKELNSMREKKVRYNAMTQNCTLLATELAKTAGVTIDQRLSRREVIGYMLPHFSSFAPFCKIAAKIASLSDTISKKTKLPSGKRARTILGMVTTIIFAPIRVINNILFNCILLGFGAGRGSPTTGKEYSLKQKAHALSALIQSPKDLLSSNPTTVYHPGPVIAWQLEQKSTCTYSYEGPSMNLLPEGTEAKIPKHLRPYKRFKIKTVPDTKSFAPITDKLKQIGKKILPRQR